MNDIIQRSILLVEDDTVTAVTERKQLEREGYKVIIASNGETAIDIICSKNQHIDLILMDIDLGPGIDGTDTAVEILKNHQIPVLFLSSHTEKEIVIKTENITSYGYVVKNSGITVLDASIKMAFKLFNANTDLIVKEKKLRKSEEKFRVLHNQSAFSISYYTPEGRVISFNERALEKMHLRMEDISGKSIYELLPGDYADIGMTRIRNSVSTEGVMEYEDFVDIPAFRGWIESTYSKIFDENNNIAGIQIISHDITERKKAEEKLNDINRTLEYQKKALSILNEIISIANSAEDLSSLYKNILEASLRLMNYDAGGIYIIEAGAETAHLVYSFNLPADFVEKAGTVSTVQEKYYDLFNKGTPIISGHYEQISPEYAEKTGFRSVISVPLYSKNRIIGALNVISKHRYVVSEDEKNTLLAIGRELGSIIERITAEDESRQNAENIRTIFNTIGEMVFILDQDRKIIQVNDSVTRRLLYTHDELAGRDIVTLNPPGQREDAARIVQEIISCKTDFCTIPFIAKDGSQIEVETRTNLALWNGQRIIIGVSRDITDRKKFEKALEEAELKFKTIFDFASDGFLGAWADDRRLSTANAKICEMLGYTEQELTEMSIDDIHPADSLPYVHHSFNSLLNKEISIAKNIPVRKKNGEVFYTDVSATPMILDGRGYLLGLFRDITDRKRTEDALRESEKMFRSIVESSPVAIYMSTGMEQKAHYINPKFIDMFGYTIDEVSEADKWWPLAYPDPEYRKQISAQWQSEISRAIEEHGTIKPIEAEITCKDGSKKNILWGFISTEYKNIAFGLDFTERKRAEEKVQILTERLNYALNTVNIGVWDLKLDDLSAWTSFKHDEIFGYSHPGRKWSLDVFMEHVFPDDLDYVKGKVMTALSTGSDWNFECRIIRKDGALRWIWSRGIQKFDKNSRPVTISGVVQDITDRKLAEEKIIKLLQEKEYLLKEVHHRVKNNMNIIAGLLTLQAETRNDAETKQILSGAAGRVHSMMILYDKLYRSEINGQLSIRVYLPSLIEEIISIFPRHKTVKIRNQIDDIILKPQELSIIGIIINELITNTMKYAFNGRDDGEITVRAFNIGKRLIITYEDNGSGIPESVSFKNSSGFGMQLINMLTEQMNGSIKIERDNGTRFVIELEP